MNQPQAPGIPGIGAMADTLDFVKNLWGSMNVPGVKLPGMTVPTMSVGELDKKIGDLKAVEAWLNVNTSMLRSTIQAMEVQRATIAALKSMNEAMLDSLKRPGPGGKSIFETMPAPSAFSPPSNVQNQTEMEKSEPVNERGDEPGKLESPPDMSSQIEKATAWWNTLQGQFKLAVNAAMSPEPTGKIEPAAPVAATPEETSPATQVKPKAVAKAPDSKTKTAAPAPKRKPSVT